VYVCVCEGTICACSVISISLSLSGLPLSLSLSPSHTLTHTQLFAEPIDLDECPDYARVILQPICLLDIREKVNNNMYMCISPFLRDIDLLVSNAKVCVRVCVSVCAYICIRVCMIIYVRVSE